MNKDKAKQLFDQAAQQFNICVMRVQDLQGTLNGLAQTMNEMRKAFEEGEATNETPASRPSRRN